LPKVVWHSHVMPHSSIRQLTIRRMWTTSCLCSIFCANFSWLYWQVVARPSWWE